MFSNIPNYLKESKEYFILFYSTAFNTIVKEKKISEKIWKNSFFKYFDKYFNSPEIYDHQQFLNQEIDKNGAEEFEEGEQIKMKNKLLKMWRDSQSEIGPLKQLLEKHNGARATLVQMLYKDDKSGRNLMTVLNELNNIINIGTKLKIY